MATPISPIGICPSCPNPLFQAGRLNCTEWHLLGYECAKKLFQSQENPSCPLCKKNITEWKYDREYSKLLCSTKNKVQEIPMVQILVHSTNNDPHHLRPTENDQIVTQLLLAAEQGDAVAQNNLGYRYKHGQGVPRCNQEAIKLYTLAANQGNATAQYNLAIMYRYGKGVLRNLEKAVELYTLAAEKGLRQAQYSLGDLYKRGHGVPQSNPKAKELFTLAAKQGHRCAQYDLKHLNNPEPFCVIS